MPFKYQRKFINKREQNQQNLKKEVYCVKVKMVVLFGVIQRQEKQYDYA
jgi:hypothetical protein